MQSDVAALALNQFRQDWPYMASLLDDMRAKAKRGSEVGVAGPRTAAPESVKFSPPVL